MRCFILTLIVVTLQLVYFAEARTCICYQFVDNMDHLTKQDVSYQNQHASDPLFELAHLGWTHSHTPRVGAITFIPGNEKMHGPSGSSMTTGAPGHVAIVSKVYHGHEVDIIGANQGCTSRSSAAFSHCLTRAGCSNVNYAYRFVLPSNTVFYYKAGAAHLAYMSSGVWPTGTNNTATYEAATGPSLQPSGGDSVVPTWLVVCVVLTMVVSLVILAAIVVLMFRRV